MENNSKCNLQLTTCEYVLAKICKRSPNLKALGKVSQYLNKKTSIEFVLGKLLEFEKAKYSVFNMDELSMMNLMGNPAIETVMGDPGKDKLQEMYKKNELKLELTVKELEIMEKNISNRDAGSLSKTQMNIIEVLV